MNPKLNIQTYVQTYIHTYPHKYIHTYTQAHTHAHTHIHTYLFMITGGIFVTLIRCSLYYLFALVVFQTGGEELPTNMVMEKQKVVIDELKHKLNLDLDRFDKLR